MPDLTPAARAALEARTTMTRVVPESPGPVLALMRIYWEATYAHPARIRGMAANQVLLGAIEGRVGFGVDDFAHIERDAGHMRQFLLNGEEALRRAVVARNNSAARSIERSLGRSAWWYHDPRFAPTPSTNGRSATRRRLYLGAEFIVVFGGEERRARLTAFVDDSAARVKIGPTAGAIPSTGFKLVTWTRGDLASHAPGRNQPAAGGA